MFNSGNGHESIFSKGDEKVLHAENDSDFRKIYNSVMQTLFRVSYRIVNDEDAAPDQIHFSLKKMRENKLGFPPFFHPKFGLFRVVKNASLNYAKRKTREKRAYERALREDTRKSESGETELLKAETIEKTKAALEKLPENLRVVLILREYAELNYKEIGRVLGISEGNVKVRIFRAREQLAKIIGENDVYLP